MNKQQILGALTLGLCIFAVFLGHENTRPLGAFEKWKSEFGMNYDSTEDSFRRLIFERNLAKIEAHNADKTQSYEMGINQFTGLTQAEFVATYLGSYPPTSEVIDVEADGGMIADTNDIDWTSKGGVTRVKNQGSCGSCWAFSATGVIESSFKIKGQTLDLSEQQLVDCSGGEGNHGCNGGWPQSALNYVQKNGIASESQYPYAAKNQACKTPGGSTRIGGIQSTTGCPGLQSAINSRPISVTVDASNWSPYRGGIFTNCGQNINHAVLLVGVVGGAWKIKNSWATGWGEQGYIRLAGGNTCGVCKMASPWSV